MVGKPLGYWRDKGVKGGAPVLVANKFVYFHYKDSPRIEPYSTEKHDGLVLEKEDFLVAPYHLCVWKDGA